jgi:hypothetical protein
VAMDERVIQVATYIPSPLSQKNLLTELEIRVPGDYKISCA